MRLEWAHAEFLGHGESLAEVPFGWLDLRGLALRGDLTEETVRMRLIAPSCVSAGEIEEASGKCACLVYAAYEEQGFTQLSEYERIEEHGVSGGNALQHLVQER